MDDRPEIIHFTFVKLMGFDIWRGNMSLLREDKSIFCKKRQNANFNHSKVPFEFDTLRHYNSGKKYFLPNKCLGNFLK
jgi:hypothetical protein